MTKKLGLKGQKFLKIIHLLFACLWIGAALSLLTINFLMKPLNGGELLGFNLALEYIDYFVIIPGAMGCLITGLLYGIFTNWGFFKFRWLIVKWVFTVILILIGTFILGPALDNIIELSRTLGLGALQDTDFLYNKKINTYVGVAQFLALVFLIVISVLKPWGKRK